MGLLSSLEPNALAAKPTIKTMREEDPVNALDVAVCVAKRLKTKYLFHCLKTITNPNIHLNKTMRDLEFNPHNLPIEKMTNLKAVFLKREH